MTICDPNDAHANNRLQRTAPPAARPAAEPERQHDATSLMRSTRKHLLSLSFMQVLSLVSACTLPAADIRILTDGQSASRAPAWSPDGTRIAFESNRHGTWSLFVLEVATGVVEQLTDTTANDRYPAWSSDGELLVYVSAIGLGRQISTSLTFDPLDSGA